MSLEFVQNYHSSRCFFAPCSGEKIKGPRLNSWVLVWNPNINKNKLTCKEKAAARSFLISSSNAPYFSRGTPRPTKVSPTQSHSEMIPVLLATSSSLWGAATTKDDDHLLSRHRANPNERTPTRSDLFHKMQIKRRLEPHVRNAPSSGFVAGSPHGGPNIQSS